MVELIIILGFAALFGLACFAATSAIAGPMPPPKPTPPPIVVSWGIQGTDSMEEAVKLASAGWEPFAVTHDRGNGQRRYYLRRRTP